MIFFSQMNVKSELHVISASNNSPSVPSTSKLQCSSSKYCIKILADSTAQKKLNRVHEREQVQNRYRTGTRMRAEQVQNGYSMDIEWIQNGNGSQKRKKAFSRMQTIRTRSSEHTLLSYAIRVLTRDLKTIQF